MFFNDPENLRLNTHCLNPLPYDILTIGGIEMWCGEVIGW